MAVNTISATHIIDHDWSFPEVFDATLVNAHFIPGFESGVNQPVDKIAVQGIICHMVDQCPEFCPPALLPDKYINENVFTLTPV
jgi:hypothetical protein